MKSSEETNGMSVQSSALWQPLQSWPAVNGAWTLDSSTRPKPEKPNDNLFLQDAFPNNVTLLTSYRSEPEQCENGLQCQVQHTDEYASETLMVRFDVEEAHNQPPAALPHGKIPDCQFDWPGDTRNLDQLEN